MAQQINDNFRLHAAKLLDDRSGPYDSVADALAGVPEYQREQGLVVVVIVAGEAKEYWWRDGVEDLDLIPKDTGGGSFDLAAAIHAATEKTTPVDADEFGIWDSVSELLRKVTWENIKATLKTSFDTLYVALTGNQTIGGIKTFTSFPVTPSEAPSTDYQVANKKYVDDNAGGAALPQYGEIAEFDLYDDGSIKRTKYDFGDSKFVENRIAYHKSGDAIGQVDFMEIKNDLTSQWIKIEYTYDGAQMTKPSTITEIIEWTITI